MATGAPKVETRPEARWQRLSRVTGVAGLLTIVLVFVPIIAQSGEEPDFNGSAEEALTFIRSVDTALAELGRFSMTVGMVAFLWFVAGLATLLRRAEGEPSWRSTVALASGVAVVPMVLDGSWDAATHRAEDLDPQLARYAFDVGNLTFTNAWVAMGSFAIACGWVMVSTGFLPRWLGWLAIVGGGGLVLARGVRLSEVWFLPYGLFWLWVIVCSVLLIRRAGSRPGPTGP